MRTYYFLLMLIVGLSLGNAQDFLVSSIDDNIKENAKAVVRLNQTTLTLKDYNQLQVERTLIITVFQSDGDGYAVMPMFYDKHTKLKNYGGEVFDANGKSIKKFKKKDYKDVSAVANGALYTDDRVLYADYTPIQYPYTIKHELSYETSNTAFLPDWIPINTYEVGIEKNEYTFMNESNVTIQTKEVNFDKALNISKQTLPKGFKYSLENVKPLLNEVLSPGFEDRIPRVLMSPNKFQLAGFGGEYSNWNDFGKWMYNDLVRDRQQLPSQEIAKIQELTAGLTDTKEKVRILYQYMQNKTRYINVAIGIGGWQPFPANDVSTKGYGDCKALSNYMMSLLKEAKIPSNYTVVYGDTDSKRSIRPDFPSLQGNHVILQVPLNNDTIWLECTSQQTAFNHLGRFTNDRYAFAMNSEGGKIVRTQSFPSEKNKEIIVGKAKINADGHLDLTYSSTTSGIQYDWNYYVFYQTKQEQENWLQTSLSDIKSKSFKSYDFVNDQNKAEFIQHIHLTSEAYSQLSGNNLIFPLVPVGRYSTSLTKDSFRELPVHIDVGFLDSSTFEIEIPNEYKLNYEIEPIVIKSEFGVYSLTSLHRDAQIQVIRKLQTFEGTFSKEKYMEYVEFRRAIEKADNTKILLEK